MANSAKNKAATSSDAQSVLKQTSEAPLTEKATSAAHEAVDSLSSKAATAEQSVRSGASSSAQTLNEKQLIAREKLDQYTEKTRDFATQNPLATAGLAFAAGMLVTSLFRRK